MIESTSRMDRPVVRSFSTTRKAVIGGAVAAVVIAGAVVFPSLSRWSRADRAVDASAIRMATVVRGDLQRDISIQGRVVAALHPTLFSSAQGIVSLRTRAGAVVKKGDILAVIESSESRSAFAQSSASLESVSADLERQKIASRQSSLRGQQQIALLRVRRDAAKRAVERAEVTFKEGLINKFDYERAQDELRVASLELAQAEADLSLNRENLEFEVRNRESQLRRQRSVTDELRKRVDELSVVAPFDGMIATVTVSDRDAIAPNQPILTIVNLDSFELEISVPEEYADDVALGTPAMIMADGREYQGKVTAISPEVVGSQVTGTVAFEGDVPKSLKQNQRLATRIVFESKKNVLKLQRGAFYESGGGEFVYVVENGVATKRRTRFGATSASEIEVIDGLREGEEVVVSDTSTFERADNVMLR